MGTRYEPSKPPTSSELLRLKEARAEREVRVKEIHAIIAVLGIRWESEPQLPLGQVMTATLKSEDALALINKVGRLVNAIPES